MVVASRGRTETIIRTITESISQKINDKAAGEIQNSVIAKRLKKSRKRLVRYGLITANVALLAVVVILINYDPQATGAYNNAVSNVAAEDAAVRANPLDQLSSADIAVNVALMTDLDETVAVVNHADSVNAQMTVASDESLAARPQIVSTDLKSKQDIVTYVVKNGDTLASVAEAHGVTSDSIRWSNNLNGSTLAPGRKLLIPPVNGIVYTVKPGDTVDSLVLRYSANRAQLIADNDAEVGGLKVGDRILIRGGVRQPATPVLSSRYSYLGGFNAAYGGNGYDYGWCTWHAANRRIQAGRPLPTNFGNAISWYYNAQRAGMAVGSQPRAGAVIWHANLGGLGHVAYVEKINSDGSLLVSDMNFPIWGRVTHRTVPQSEFGSYRFIY